MRRIAWGAEHSGGPRRGRWTAPEIARLKELYGLRDEESIAKLLNRPVSSVRRMAEQIFKLATRTGPWSAREVADLRKFLGGTNHETIQMPTLIAIAVNSSFTCGLEFSAMPNSIIHLGSCVQR